jgi:hypothetical protein
MPAFQKRRSSKVDIEINAQKIDVHFTRITSLRNTGAINASKIQQSSDMWEWQ